MSNELTIFSGDALTQEEQKALNLELDNIIGVHKNNRQAINKLVFECVALMSEAEGYSAELSKKDFLSSLIGSITGSNRKLQNKINSNIGTAQYASQQCLQKLAEQNLMTFDLITAVNNKLNASLTKVDVELNQIYECLDKFFKKNKSDLFNLATRLEKVEQNMKLLEWAWSIKYGEFDGEYYINLDDISKIVCLARDFYDLTKGQCTTGDLRLLKTAMSTLDINPEDVINYYDAVKVIAEDNQLKCKLFNTTDLMPVTEPKYLMSASSIQKISAMSNEESYVITSIEEYINDNGVMVDNEELLDEVVNNYMAEKARVNLNIEIECFDFILDLLYNLQNYEEAIVDYVEMVQKEDVDVSPKEEDILIENEDVSLKEKNILIEDADIIPDGNLKENYELIKDMSENGSGMAMYLLAEYFIKVRDDEHKYNEWLNKAVEANNLLGKLRYYTKYKKERVIDEKLLNDILYMAENGNIYAMYELGRFYDVDEINRNYEEAVKWYRKAAEQGYAPAQNNLGDMYQYGRGVMTNYYDAVQWYGKAAAQGLASAQNNLGNMYCYDRGVTKNYEVAVRWYEKAATQGYIVAQYKLGNMYYYGRGVTKNYYDAAQWYKKAAERGLAEAQNNLGWMYRNGYGVGRDYEEAVKWYRKAAEQGLAEAQNKLGFMYHSGYGVYEDYEEAAKWFRKAAEQGLAKAQFNLGDMYKHGFGVNLDLKEAVKWFRKAAEQEYADAQYQLGVMYENGWGVDANNKEAVQWYKKAAEQGNTDAQNKLKNFDNKKSFVMASPALKVKKGWFSF